ncbi:MAG: type II toxin-antitoxin system VapC family toxin [Phyllobacteriaceae bacterium]|nr:type II toxin-antitoxin system VapC family toxin [Phyllobacteriaceae bacterium]
MIGLDTNVLVRLFVRDDDEQMKSAQALIAGCTSEQPAYVSSVVIAELAWVLDRSYGYAAGAIHEAFEWLFDSENIVVERSELMEAAILTARDAKADISDAIIAALATDANCTAVVTFDKNAAKRIPGMELIA